MALPSSAGSAVSFPFAAQLGRGWPRRLRLISINVPSTPRVSRSPANHLPFHLAAGHPRRAHGGGRGELGPQREGPDSPQSGGPGAPLPPGGVLWTLGPWQGGKAG